MPTIDRHAPFLAADIGGTHARMALVVARPGDVLPQIIDARTYACAHHASFLAIARDFLSAQVPVQDAVIACAGLLVDDRVVNTNIPWPVRPSSIQQALGLRSLAVLNDLSALAHATPQFAASNPIALDDCSAPDGDRPMLVLAPGTGLGAALWLPGKRGAQVLPTEAGQAAVAAVTTLELELRTALAPHGAYLPNEAVLSGPGILRLYRALCVLRGVPPLCDSPKAISAAAQARNDATAAEALHVFCNMLGGLIGDLVLTLGAYGGVYLGGGILPQVQGALRASHFRERMVDKGRMRALLEPVPVRLLTHPHLGILGAANWWLRERD